MRETAASPTYGIAKNRNCVYLELKVSSGRWRRLCVRYVVPEIFTSVRTICHATQTLLKCETTATDKNYKRKHNTVVLYTLVFFSLCPSRKENTVFVLFLVLTKYCLLGSRVAVEKKFMVYIFVFYSFQYRSLGLDLEKQNQVNVNQNFTSKTNGPQLSPSCCRTDCRHPSCHSVRSGSS